MTARSSLILCSLAFLLSGLAGQAQESQSPPTHGEDLTAMNIEDLMNVKVTSVSRTEEKLSRTAAAVFVIGPEDIRSSGAQNLPDLLRMVPGVDVAQITSNTWAISVRGFNSRYSNKLLVLLDGRAVYSAGIGGVFWDVLDLPLEDIERIEVIRGPGGSVWGANAVDGVINILTKKADETHGGLITAGGGNVDQGFGTVQYGGNLADKTDYRVFTKYLNDDRNPDAAGQPGGDAWHLLTGGFRSDTALSAADTLMVQGNIYTGSEDVPVTFLQSVSSPTLQSSDAPAPLSGGYIQSVWNHTFSPGTGTTLEGSYYTYRRDDELREQRRTVDLDFQHHFRWGDRQNVLWGLFGRYSVSHTDGGFFYFLEPPTEHTNLFSSFVQDEIALIPNRLNLTAGLRVERDYYAGWAAMPSVRSSWQINDRHMVWVAYSRAVRTPAENDTAARVNAAEFTGQGGIPNVIEIFGNPNFGDEILDAYEAGYRAAVSDKLSVDLAAYYNHYADLETREPGAPFLVSTPAPLHLVLPLTYENLMYGETHGLEIYASWKPVRRWSIRPGYAFEEIHMHTEPSSQDTSSVAIAQGSSPRHSAQLRSRVLLSHGLEWDASAYFVDRLPYEVIPAYTRVDTQLTWKFGERGSFSVVGQNLQQDHHFEFQDWYFSINSTQFKRSAYAMIRWGF